MSFLIDVTPFTLCANSTALLMSDWEPTKPLNWTTPLKVSTLISADFKVGSLNMAALTLVVMTLSSTYSPVPSFVGVDAQPKENSNAKVIKNTAKYLSCFMIDLLKKINTKSNSKVAHHQVPLLRLAIHLPAGYIGHFTIVPSAAELPG